jgi:hypothetical protein
MGSICLILGASLISAWAEAAYLSGLIDAAFQAGIIVPNAIYTDPSNLFNNFEGIRFDASSNKCRVIAPGFIMRAVNT